VRPAPTSPAWRSTALALWLALAAGAVPFAATPARAQAAPILVDGTFGDWTGTVEHVDPAGDAGTSGIDFRAVDLANDDDYLFVRFETTKELVLQENSNVVLYLDTDMNAATGLSVGGIGAELEWNFGTRSGCFRPIGGCVPINHSAISMRSPPTVSGSVFECSIARAAIPDGVHPLFGGGTIRALLRDTGSGGDFAPNAGGVTYAFDATPTPQPSPIPFARLDPADVRIVTWNTRDLEGGGGFDAGVTPSADRVLSAIDPDIVSFQEVYNASAAQTQALIQGFLGGTWYAAKQNDCIVVSRFPVLQSWALDGNLAVQLDADASLGTDLLFVSAHLPCCTNDAGRRQEIDRIMAFLRDAMTAGGSVNVPIGTAFMVTGDLNLVGQSSQLNTLLTGDIYDEGTWGPDFAPDWDGTGLADLISRQTERRFAYTWRSDFSSYSPGRLDFIIYNDSVLEARNHFIVYSPEMSPAERAATGILAGDVTTVSDHLPHVGDFRAVPTASAGGPLAPGALAFAGGTYGRGRIRSVLELGVAAEVEIGVFDARGARVRTLADGLAFAAGRHAIVWDGRTDDGHTAASGIYFARATARGAGASRRARATWVLLH